MNATFLNLSYRTLRLASRTIVLALTLQFHTTPSVAQVKSSRPKDAAWTLLYEILSVGQKCSVIRQRLESKLSEDGFKDSGNYYRTVGPASPITCRDRIMKFSRYQNSTTEEIEVRLLNNGTIYGVTQSYSWNLDAGPSKRALLQALIEKFGSPRLLSGEISDVRAEAKWSSDNPKRLAGVAAYWSESAGEPATLELDEAKVWSNFDLEVSACLGTGKTQQTCRESVAERRQAVVNVFHRTRSEVCSGVYFHAHIHSTPPIDIPANPWLSQKGSDELSLTLVDQRLERVSHEEGLSRETVRKRTQVDDAKESVPALR